jgi:hypothetical protein
MFVVKTVIKIYTCKSGVANGTVECLTAEAKTCGG